MNKSIAFSIAAILLSITTPASAAVKAQADGWGFQTVDANSLMGRMLGSNTKALLVKAVAKPDEVGPTIRILEIKADTSKLKGDVEAWRTAILVGMQSKPAILNERILTNGGQTRYYIEYQTDSHTESMLQTALVGTVINGKLYLMLFENRQSIFQRDIADVRKVFETTRLTVE